jgi:aspartyl-tRNA synthetase
LPQSPQLYKQLLMVSGFDRYFQIARCFRDEDLRADRQPEFTQIDIEASFVTRDDIFAICEEMLSVLWLEGGVGGIAGPFVRLAHADSMENYGTDRPDTRYDLQLFDASNVFRSAEIGFVQAAVAAGGRVRGLVVPAATASTLSRKIISELEQLAKGAGAGGLMWLRRGSVALEGSVGKFMKEEHVDALGIAVGETAFFVVGPDSVSSPALDRVRQELARRLSMIPAGKHCFLWVTDFPLFARDAQTGVIVPEHHPFTAPHPDDIHLLGGAEPHRARALAYDAVYNGMELASGSIRIHDPATQRRIFTLLGIDEATAQKRFGFLLEGLLGGAPPHGGIAFGFDRIAMLLAGASSLRDVIAFPKTTAARSLFEGAPTVVDAADLHELHLRIEGVEDNK